MKDEDKQTARERLAMLTGEELSVLNNRSASMLGLEWLTVVEHDWVVLGVGEIPWTKTPHDPPRGPGH